MRQRKESQYFFVCVEGECERLYLNRLKKIINECTHGKFCFDFKPEFDRKVSSLRRNRASIKSEYVFYFWDKEGESGQDEDCFCKVFEDLRQLQKAWPSIEIRPGYSHLSFELWILLHRQDFKTPLSSKKKYLDHINRAFGTSFESLDEYKAADNFRKLVESIELKDVFNAIRRADAIREFHEENESASHPIHRTSPHTAYQTNPDILIQDCIRTILKICKIKEPKS